jgi:hypothetical protein
LQSGITELLLASKDEQVFVSAGIWESSSALRFKDKFQGGQSGREPADTLFAANQQRSQPLAAQADLPELAAVLPPHRLGTIHSTHKFPTGGYACGTSKRHMN